MLYGSFVQLDLECFQHLDGRGHGWIDLPVLVFYYFYYLDSV